jgi:hypothetical protein
MEDVREAAPMFKTRLGEGERPASRKRLNPDGLARLNVD